MCGHRANGPFRQSIRMQSLNIKNIYFIINLRLQRKQKILQIHLEFAYFSFFLTHLVLKRWRRSYHPVVPSKTMPDSRPKWAKCIPVFRPKPRKNPTRWGGTIAYIREYPPWVAWYTGYPGAEEWECETDPKGNFCVVNAMVAWTSDRSSSFDGLLLQTITSSREKKRLFKVIVWNSC